MYRNRSLISRCNNLRWNHLTRTGSLSSAKPCFSYLNAKVVSQPPSCQSIQNYSFHTTIQRQGVMDSFRDVYENAFSGNEAKKEAEVFKVQLQYLRSDKPIEGERFLSLISEMRAATGLSGMKEHLPWVQNNPALAEFKKQETIAKILAAEGSIGNPRIGVRKRAAAAANAELHEVDAVVMQAFQMNALQKWIQGRERDGLSLPKNSEEMQRMASAPNSGIKGMKKARRMPSPGVRVPKKMKRGY